MTGIETTVLHELCDKMMRSYIDTKQNADEQDAIIDKLSYLRESLNQEQKQLLNQLLDNINGSDSKFAYEAFLQGVLLGIKLMSNNSEA